MQSGWMVVCEGFRAWGVGFRVRDSGLRVYRLSYLKHCVLKVDFQTSILIQIRQLILCISNSERYVDGFIGELTSAKQLQNHFVCDNLEGPHVALSTHQGVVMARVIASPWSGPITRAIASPRTLTTCNGLLPWLEQRLPNAKTQVYSSTS